MAKFKYTLVMQFETIIEATDIDEASEIGYSLEPNDFMYSSFVDSELELQEK